MKKRKWLGVLLNLVVPGLGNAYARNVKKGLVVWVGFFIVLFSWRFVAYNYSLLLVCLLLVLGSILYLIVSGYRDVIHDKTYEPHRIDKWYVYVLIILLYFFAWVNLDGRTLIKLAPVNSARVATPSMDPTLRVGDIFIFQKSKLLSRNDIAVYWFPNDLETMYVHRCIGTPGDTVKIQAGNAFLNGVAEKEKNLKYSFLVTTDGPAISSTVLEENHIEGPSQLGEQEFQFFLTSEQEEIMISLKVVQAVDRLMMMKEGERDDWMFVKSENWNADFFGPLYVPRKGDKLELNERNIGLYLKCIETENDEVRRDSSGLIIDGVAHSHYVSKENYYFIMGDNRNNALDSRFWGLLPESLVIGKGMYVAWSELPERIGTRLE